VATAYGALTENRTMQICCYYHHSAPMTGNAQNHVLAPVDFSYQQVRNYAGVHGRLILGHVVSGTESSAWCCNIWECL